MTRRKRLEVMAYPIGSWVFIKAGTQIYEVEVRTIEVNIQGGKLVPLKYSVVYDNNNVTFYASKVFPTKKKLLDSL